MAVLSELKLGWEIEAMQSLFRKMNITGAGEILQTFTDIHTKPFVEAARIYQWPDKVVSQAAGSELKARETFCRVV